MPTVEQYPIRHRYTNAVTVTAEISVTPDMLPSAKLGLAVRWAVNARANLTDANLSDANLAGVDLTDAVLTDADLARANLTDANLTHANLTRVNLTGADLTRANLTRANLTRANLTRVNLTGSVGGANLTGANLTGADLADANLTGAHLYGANLTGANLTGAYLAGAKNITDEQLRPIIADLWFILSQARNEIPAMIYALRNGRVDGSTYSGDCACLVGTLEHAGASGLPHDVSSPAERWFETINEGDKPGDDSRGGFASAKALEWIEQYCRVTGIELPA